MLVAKVKDAPGMVRDMGTQALLNTDINALEAYRRKRNKQQELDEVISDINNMKSDIDQIKSLMQRILEKIG
jgi:uncharacterized protein with von Willebrand factor type A (vWA) domain